MIHARITGTGSYLPARVLGNAELERMVDTSSQWILERTGIEERRIAAEDEFTSDLAEHAARHALEAAQCAASDIDLILVATTTPDHTFPSVATQIQHRLGAPACAAFDLQAVCSGFVYALTVAEKFIRSGSHHRALVIGAETFSRIIDWNDRGTCILFGDGAGAVVLEASDTPGILDSRLQADGRHRDLLWVPEGVSTGTNPEAVAGGHVRMKGNEVFRAAVNVMGQLVSDSLAACQLTVADLDWLVPHQANARILAATARKLQLPTERVVSTVRWHGNTSAASVPLALDTAVRDGRIRPGQTVLLEAFGGGFTWGAVLLRY